MRIANSRVERQPAPEDGKFALLSTTQIAGFLGQGLVIYGIYAQMAGKPSFELSTEQLTAVATVVCFVLMQLQRFRPNQKKLYWKLWRVVKAHKYD